MHLSTSSHLTGLSFLVDLEITILNFYGPWETNMIQSLSLCLIILYPTTVLQTKLVVVDFAFL